MRDAVTLPPIPADEAAAVAGPIVERARSLQVTSLDEHAAALEFERDLARGRKAIVELFAEPKSLAHAAHKAITAAEAKVLRPLDAARAEVSAKRGAYEAEQRRIAEAEQRRLQAEADARAEAARRAEEDARLAAAAAAEDAGDQHLAEALIEAPAPPPMPAPVVRVAPELAKVEGVSTRQIWSAEVADLLALVRHVATHPQDLDCLGAVMPNLNRRAVSQRQALNLPGVRAVSRSVSAVRS